MSAVLDLGEGRYIAGEAPERPGAGKHWCFSCAGSGIELGGDGELGVCVMCVGTCMNALQAIATSTPTRESEPTNDRGNRDPISHALATTDTWIHVIWRRRVGVDQYINAVPSPENQI